MTSIEIKVNGREIELPQETVDKILAALPKEPAGRWEPAVGDTYFFLDDEGNPESLRWQGRGLKLWRYSQRNVFRTREEALAHKRYLEAVARLRDSSDFVPNWDDGEKLKFYVIYDHFNGGLRVTNWDKCDYGTIAYYPTLKAAQQSIKDHREDWLTYFGMAS